MAEFNPFSKHDWEKAGKSAKHDADKAAKAAKKAADEAKKQAEKAAEETKKAAEEAAEQAKKAAEQAEKELESAIMTNINDITHLGDSIKSDLNHLGDGIKRDVQHLADTEKQAFAKALSDAKHAVDTAESNATHAIETAKATADAAGKQALDEALSTVRSEAVKARGALEDAGKTVENGIADFGQKIIDEAKAEGETIKKNLQDFEHSLEEAMSEGVLKEAIEKAHKLVSWLADHLAALGESHPALVETLDSISDQIELGPITLNYDNFYTRIQDLAKVLSDTLDGEIEVKRTFIIGLVTDLGPSSVAINLDVEVFATFGDKIPELPFAVFTEIADDILKEIGVPD